MSDYERQRLNALRQLNLLDTPPSESFDRITRMASRLFDLPISAVSLTDKDRQWFKSRVGTELWELPRLKSPCSDIAATSDVLVIEDLLESDCFRDSPHAQLGLRFYAGAPLTTRDGYTLGSLCVLGFEPRTVTEEEIQSLRDLGAMVMAQIELQHALGRIDPTTGLPNRSQFDENMADLARESPGARRFALFIELVGVVQLNTLNRVMGPTQLDELAREGSQILQAQLAPGETLYSIGPCQYLLLRKARLEADVSEEARRLHAQLKALNLRETLPVMVRPVVGVAPFRLGRTTPGDVLRLAHGACQDARDKEMPVSWYSRVLDEEHRRRFDILTQMRQALETSEGLRLLYQPRLALESGTCVGAEALLRWQHPQLGEVSPSEFIPLVENSALARPLTTWVMRSAISQAAIWYHQGLTLRVSFNVMASNLEQEDFTERLLQCMAYWNLPHHAIELELTESSVVGSGSAARHQLNSLAEAGIRIAIDDFGTGYSSLAYLLKIPAKVVKIDRAFTNREYGEERSDTLLKAMISLARELGYLTVAEGFAPMNMLETLGQVGCDEVQSHMIAEPMPAEAFETWLNTFSQQQ